MNTSMSSSFVNIDLDDDELFDDIQQQQESGDLENKDDDNSLNVSGGLDNNLEDDDQIDTKKKEPSDLSSKNELLDRMSKQLTNDYSKYFNLTPDSQIEELNECIDNLLTHMEEFYGLVEMIRCDNTICLDQIMDTFQPKLEQCQQLYKMIDKLERIVSFVSMQLNLMEREVCKAEEMMGKKSAVKRLFSLISSHQSSSSNHSYVRPDIFKTEDLLQM